MLARCIFMASLLLGPMSALGSQPAHGDFPGSTGVVFQDPKDEIPIVVTNYGYLFYEGEAEWDGVSNWSWVCEEIFPETAYPESFQATPDGYFVGGIYGLYRSDDGCNWEGPAIPGLDGLYVTQILPEPGNPSRLYASTSTNGAENGIFLSTDGGRRFDLFKGFGEGTTVRGFMMGEGGAPIYVVGWELGAPRVWISKDGSTWAAHGTEGTEGGSVFPLGLDQEDGSIAYLRVALPDEGGDRLLRVTLEGEFDPLLDIDDLDAFGARGPLLEAGGRGSGYRTSEDGGGTWSEAAMSPEFTCVTYRGEARYQCANNFADGASVFLGDPYGEDATPLQRFGEVRGVKACPESSPVFATCGIYWESVKVLLGFDEPTPTPTATPAHTPTPGTQGGCGGCGGEGGAAGGLLLLLSPWGWRRS